jgi:hypothetical protein
MLQKALFFFAIALFVSFAARLCARTKPSIVFLQENQHEKADKQLMLSKDGLIVSKDTTDYKKSTLK